MNFWRKFIAGIGFLMIIGGMIVGTLYLVGRNAQAQVVQAVAATPTIIIPVTGTVTSEVTEIATSTATLVPTPTLVISPKTVDGYLLGGKIDLSSEAPVALTLHLPGDKLMSTNWAGLIHDQGLSAEDQKKAFSPSKGVIYSYQADVLTTWAHSGTGVGGKPYFFATNLDFYIRKNPENRTVTLAEAQEKAATLKGVTAYLCQAEPRTIAFLTDHNANSPCRWEEVELELVAVAVVPHEKLDDYNLAIFDINDWMIDNFPEAGFEELNEDNGWLIRFCIGRFSDQVDDGTPWYSHNAGVVGFRIKDNGE